MQMGRTDHHFVAYYWLFDKSLAILKCQSNGLNVYTIKPIFTSLSVKWLGVTTLFYVENIAKR